MSVYPTESNILTALRTFLIQILPTGTEVILAQVNRVPEPQVEDFVVMTPIRRTRLETNIDAWADVRFIGSIAADVMTVSDLTFGTIVAGQVVFGVGVTVNTRIVEAISGTGGTGTYRVTPSQTVSSGVLASGESAVTQPTEVVIQLDVHGPASAENAQTISTLMRDPYGVDSFATQDPQYGVVPLYADDPRQVVFINDQSQAEFRWVIEANLQANIVVGVPQQYADSVTVELIDVDVVYPPT